MQKWISSVTVLHFFQLWMKAKNNRNQSHGKKACSDASSYKSPRFILKTYVLSNFWIIVVQLTLN